MHAHNYESPPKTASWYHSQSAQTCCIVDQRPMQQEHQLSVEVDHLW